MKQSIYNTADKLTVDGDSYYVVEVLYSERMKEYIYILENKHMDGWYMVLTEEELLGKLK